MSIAIKVSDALAEEARAAAEDADRSLTGQIEHWARLGKAMEPHFSASTIAFLKKNGGLLSPEDEQVAIKQTLAALDEFRKLSPADIREKLGLADQILYDADPDDSDGVIQVHPNGTRVRGKIVGREFVPNE